MRASFTKLIVKTLSVPLRRCGSFAGRLLCPGAATLHQEDNSMASIRLDQVRDAGFLHEVEEESGQNISTCYQCGNCTAGCPGSGFYDRQVSQIMRAVQLGLKDEALRNRSLWLCLSCSTCTARCPNNIDVARVMETLRHMARREGLVQDRPIESFWKSFLDTVKLTGRSFEIGVMADYMMRTGRGWGNMDMAPTALLKGKLPFLPSCIRGRDEVARIFKRYAETKKEGQQ